MKEKEQYLKDTDLIYSTNVVFIQELYRKYLNDQNSVDQKWQEYFSNIGDELADICSDFDGASWSEAKLNVIGANTEVAIKKKAKKAQKQDPALKNSDLEYKVARLINRLPKIWSLQR